MNTFWAKSLTLLNNCHTNKVDCFRFLRYVSGIVSTQRSHLKPKFCVSRKRDLFWGSCGFISGVVGYYSYIKSSTQHADSTRWRDDWDVQWRGQHTVKESCDSNVSSSVVTTPYAHKTRHILLIRHGQYKNPYCKDDTKQGLTPLGEEQAHFVGRHLSEVLKGKKVRGIFHSNMKV